MKAKPFGEIEWEVKEMVAAQKNGYEDLTLDELAASDIERIVKEQTNSISIMDHEGNVLMTFVGVEVGNFVGFNIREMNEVGGIYQWSPCLKVIETKEGLVGTVKSRYGEEQTVIATPLMDENGEIALVVDVALDKKLIDKYFSSIKPEKPANARFKASMEYLSSGDTFAHVPIAESPVMKKIVKMCNTIAKTDSAVMITGESGTGKEVLARYIHRHSSRANEPFIPVNCAAIPHDLLEAEFFGYEKGAFTGANPKGKPGLFEMADKGTLFLDEIADLPLSMQSKLLRVLESGEIKHVGGTTIKHTDVRLISATNKNLREMIANKQFRADVYYRLSVIPITVPSLRERPEDILALSKKFLNGINAKYNFSKKLTRETIEAFYEYDWPGNVRELRNVIERLAITSVDDELHFEVGLSTNGDRVAEPVKYLPEITSRETLKNFMDRVEAEYIETVLAESNGRVCEAAKRLGIHRTLLYRKIREKINK
jgi:transcriptional regulator with PAS, ATPase and Fis domain